MAQVVLGELKKTLVEQMKSGGVGHAAKFCSVQASSVQEEASKKIPGNITVARVTDRPRNFSNAADEVDLEVMRLFRDDSEKQAPIKRTLKSGNRRYYMPIAIEAPCLSCHGATETLSEDILTILRAKYPNDKATEYKLGELRGLVRVEVR